MTEAENSVSAGIGSDLKVASVAAMTPFIMGVAILLGWAWLDVFGVLLGIGGGIWWAVWWYKRNDDKFFPRDVAGGPYAITIVITVALLIFALATL
ncbi:hypothetical protein [Labedaea rhizosphaerae]|uniref:Uncharacterized protein n=1 Tax=Labedaea rhizosphaerae TaxID=598644 RepID=A0A4R6S8B9_LABRH|nr:hypothetical protein [Labedaea rhizosphaerae]TDP96122.1 hypothetical protein EV186_104102 [Labedaea rhizosphaerae]